MSHRYVIAHPKLGTVGDPYDPPVWVNPVALLAGGFIARVSAPEQQPESPAPAPPPPAKIRRNSAPDRTKQES